MIEEKQKKFVDALKASNGIQEILECGASTLENPVSMFDLRYKLLAHTHTAVSDDRFWNELMATGTFSHETVNFMKEEGFIEAYLSSPIALMKSPRVKYDRINGMITTTDGVQLANISIVACHRPFEDEDYKLIDLLCKHLAEEIQRNGMLSELPQVCEYSVLTDLIEGRAADESEIKKISRELKEYIYVALVDIIQYDNSLSHLIYFRDMLRRCKKECKYYEYLNNIVILFSSNKPILNMENELDELNSFFKQSNLYAGVSMCFKSLLDIKVYFKQALNALNYGMSLCINKNIFPYDIFGVECFFNAHIDDANMKKMCHPIFYAMHEYDKKKNTNYLETLYGYFNSGLKIEKAAKELKMDCDKLALCLNRATNLFKIDFSDGNMIFAIFRAIKFYKCFPERFV